MKERLILFSGPMVRAILDDHKTETRRVVKPQPPIGHVHLGWVVESSDRKHEGCVCWGDKPGPFANGFVYARPPARTGDRLWVREEWGLLDTEPKDGPDNATVFYRATDGDRHDLRYQRWRPSIYMPRWASRLTLEVTGVRVERLQAITEEGAKAEGTGSILEGTACPRHLEAFQRLWDAINGKRPGCDWTTNPWVWVVQFKRVQP